MMVYLGHYDGMVSGAVNSTGDTVRPALQIIKTKPVTLGSRLHVDVGTQRRGYIFSDVAINMKPDAQELAEIAVVSAATARRVRHGSESGDAEFFDERVCRERRYGEGCSRYGTCRRIART